MNDITHTQFDAYQQNPKYNWVYDTGKILSMQKIQWNHFKTQHTAMISAMNYHDDITITDVSHFEKEDYHKEGYIFCVIVDKQPLRIDMVIHKGTCKWLMCYNKDNDVVNVVACPGNISIRVNAFLKIYFSKYSGFLSFTTVGNIIVSADLSINKDMMPYYERTPNWLMKVKKIYQGKAWGK